MRAGPSGVFKPIGIREDTVVSDLALHRLRHDRRVPQQRQQRFVPRAKMLQWVAYQVQS